MRARLLVVCSILLNSCVTKDPSQADYPLSIEAPLGAIPKRAANAMTGSQFLRSINGLDAELREQAILREFRAGNIPSGLRSLRAVSVKAMIDGREHKGVVWVMPDYLAIGSDTDYAYMPMNPLTAQRIADHYGFLLPTPKLVDAVYQQAQIRLSPAPMSAGPEMVGTPYFERHNRTIRVQLGARSMTGLTVGHKKDVVLTNRLSSQRRRVAIYGWHKQDGRPIQPLSLVHHDRYADYSHGVRLVANVMLIDGEEKPVAEVMQSRRYAPLISDEGPMAHVRIVTDCSGC